MFNRKPISLESYCLYRRPNFTDSLKKISLSDKHPENKKVVTPKLPNITNQEFIRKISGQTFLSRFPLKYSELRKKVYKCFWCENNINEIHFVLFLTQK